MMEQEEGQVKAGDPTRRGKGEKGIKKKKKKRGYI